MSGNTLCVIPARGGSKRLPRKNVLQFRGKPMLLHTIEAAQQSDCFERILVSSEDAEILAVARAAGVMAAERPTALASDEARVVPVLLDLLEREAEAGRRYDVICCLYPAAPLRGAADIRAVLALIEPGVADFAMAVTEFSHPPHQALRLGEGSALTPQFPELVSRRDAEIGHLVVDNGSTYAASVEALRAHASFYGPGLRGHLMPRARSVDINLPDDLDLADYFYGRLRT